MRGLVTATFARTGWLDPSLVKAAPAPRTLSASFCLLLSSSQNLFWRHISKKFYQFKMQLLNWLLPVFVSTSAGPLYFSGSCKLPSSSASVQDERFRNRLLVTHSGGNSDFLRIRSFRRLVNNSLLVFVEVARVGEICASWCHDVWCRSNFIDLVGATPRPLHLDMCTLCTALLYMYCSNKHYINWSGE